MADWIALVESAYDLTPEPGAWLEQVVAQAAPLLDAGSGVTGMVFDVTPSTFRVEQVFSPGPSELQRFAVAANQTAAPAAVDLVYRSGIPAATLSEVVFAKLPGAADVFARSNDGRFRDALGIVAHTGTGKGVALTTPLEQPRKMSRLERMRWTRIAAHVGAGLRLRLALGGVELESDTPEARLSPAGELCDARGPAASSRARTLLRAAVWRAERARGSLRRRDPDEALDLWQGLVAGRWSLVDHHDHDGRRFVAALPNDPELGDPRGLSRRERQVAEFVGMGRASKEIAYVLGVSASAVDNVIGRIRQKLGLASRAEVVAFFAPQGIRAHLTQLALAGETLLVGSYPLLGSRALAALTPAEGDVAVLLLQGYTNAAIAAGRTTAVRTVANQVQAIFSKVGVGSRAELAATIQAGTGNLGRGA